MGQVWVDPTTYDDDDIDDNDNDDDDDGDNDDDLGKNHMKHIPIMYQFLLLVFFISPTPIFIKHNKCQHH